MAYDSPPSADLHDAAVSATASLTSNRKDLPRNRYVGLRKRGLDLALVALAAPVALPVIVILWALVRLDGGRGFYCQTRIGRDGRPFRFWKLRSMVPDAEARLKALCAADPELAREWLNHQKLENDPRVTRIGRILRKTSLDELPQLWNILRGDMSVVGPRPFMPDQQHLYVGAGGRSYFRLKPGVTGTWQVRGRSATRFVDRVRFDEYYYRTATARGDIRLIAATVGVVLRMTGR